MATEIIADGNGTGFPVQVTIAVAFGCPFEGDVPLSRIQRMADELAAAGPVELALADTIGVGVPMQQAFNTLKQQLDDLPLRAHFHTRNTGIANAYAALMAGVRSWMPVLVVLVVALLRRTPAVISLPKISYTCSAVAVLHTV